VLGPIVACIRTLQERAFKNPVVSAARGDFIVDWLERLAPNLKNLMLFALFDPRYRAVNFADKLPATLPAYNTQWQTAATRAREQLLQEYAEAVRSEVNRLRASPAPLAPTPTAPAPAKTAEAAFFQHFASLSGPEQEVNELSRYLEGAAHSVTSETRPLEWWRENAARFPTMAQLARKYLAVPASNAEIERVFSHAKLQLPDRRNRMAVDLLESLLIIKLANKTKGVK